MTKMTKITGVHVFIVLFAAYLLGCGNGIFIGYRNGDRMGAERGVMETRTSAINYGVGEYVVTNELTGATGWVWKTNTIIDTVPEGSIGLLSGY